MAWIEVHQTLREHKKLLSCADQLRIEPVKLMGMLVSLWLWSLDNAPDGRLSGISEKMLARVMCWPEKKASVLVKALTEANWLEEQNGTLRIHDWHEYAGRLMERREKDRARKKKENSPKKQEASGNSAGIPAEFQRQSPENPALPYLTVPNHTVPNPTLPNHSILPGQNTSPVPAAPPPEAPSSVSQKSFLSFWEAYPVQIGQAAAWEAWCMLHPTQEQIRAILAALDTWKASSRWKEQGGRYIPRASKWLAECHWKNPPSPEQDPIPKGASGELGQAEIEAIERMMREYGGEIHNG